MTRGELNLMSFRFQHELKLTYEHCNFQKFSVGYTPDPRLRGDEKGLDKEKERKTGEERMAIRE
jgi:hypothetical protein